MATLIVFPIATVELEGLRYMFADAAETEVVNNKGVAAITRTEKIRIMRFTINTIITHQSA
jgi:hypothetical protein